MHPRGVQIRLSRPNGTKTEFEKILDGWGDWFFYGHSISDYEIRRWMVVDLHAFRDIFPYKRHLIECGIKTNPDGTQFYWFDVRPKELQERLLVASSGGRRCS
jgi:hypothetical protein